jgi:hypothetical protein
MDSLQFPFSVRLHAPRKSPIDGTQGSVLSGSDSEREEKNGRRLNYSPRLHRHARSRTHARAPTRARTRRHALTMCTHMPDGIRCKAEGKCEGEEGRRENTKSAHRSNVQYLESSGSSQEGEAVRAHKAIVHMLCSATVHDIHRRAHAP